MNFSPLTLYVLAAIFQTAGSSGAAMLAPFFMKAHGYSVAAAGVPLVANGVGRVCSDVMSGIMATYFSPGSLLFAAMIIGIATSIVGYAFMDAMPVFLTAWIIFGLTEAMFALSLRKIGFDQSPPDRQGSVQGQMASALGIGFTLGPLFGRYVGGRLCDRFRPASVILLGVALGVPMLLLQVFGSGWVTLMIPLAIMTMGFGFTNVGATTFALQSPDRGAKELALGISRASTSFGQAIGPLVCGALIEQMGYEGGFQTMAVISAVVLIVTWIGLRKQPAGA